MKQSVFFITPPFTQLNTPYPATAYLKGFLNTQNITSYQADLGIEVILELFSSKGLLELFESIDLNNSNLSDNSKRIINLKKEYIKTIDPVISFLHDKNPTISHIICERNYLPEASRFHQLEDLEWAFGTMGTKDKARHFATLYLEDISDLIIEAIDPNFGFSRYAERLGRSASSFDELHTALKQENTYIDSILLSITPLPKCIAFGKCPFIHSRSSRTSTNTKFFFSFIHCFNVSAFISFTFAFWD